MRGHARDREALRGPGALDEISPAAPVGVGHHRLSADLMEGDILRGMACRGRDRQGSEDAIGIARGPLQNLHAAHRAAGDAKERLDAKVVEQQGLRPHHVGDGDDRKVEPERVAGLRVDRRRAGGAHAAAEDIRADDEESVGVEGPAGTDHRFPPAGPACHRMKVRDMLVCGQRVADEKGVRARRVEGAIGLIGDGERRESRARIHDQRRGRIDAEREAVRRRGLAQGAIRQYRCLAHRGPPFGPIRSLCRTRRLLYRKLRRAQDDVGWVVSPNGGTSAVRVPRNRRCQCADSGPSPRAWRTR